MIRVNLTFDENGRLLAICTKGHARRNPLMEMFSPVSQRFNAVCAAVSSLESTLLVSLQELATVSPRAQTRRGFFELSLAGVTRTAVLETILSVFVVGMKLISQSHPQHISLTSNHPIPSR